MASLVFGGASSDRVRLAGSVTDNQSTYTVIQWIFWTTLSLRVLWCKGLANSRKIQYLSGAGGTVVGHIDRASADADLTTTTAVSANVWTCVAGTYDDTDGMRVFLGTLTTAMAEASYASRVVGSGACVDESAVDWTIGNVSDASPTLALQGRIAFTAHYRRRFSLAEVQAYQYRPINDSDCDLFMMPGWSGTGDVPNWGSLGAADNGVITGCSLGDGLPLIFPSKGASGWRGNPTTVAAGDVGPLLRGGRLLHGKLLRGGRLVA